MAAKKKKKKKEKTYHHNRMNTVLMGSPSVHWHYELYSQPVSRTPFISYTSEDPARRWKVNKLVKKSAPAESWFLAAAEISILPYFTVNVILKRGQLFSVFPHSLQFLLGKSIWAGATQKQCLEGS